MINKTTELKRATLREKKIEILKLIRGIETVFKPILPIHVRVLEIYRFEDALNELSQKIHEL